MRKARVEKVKLPLNLCDENMLTSMNSATLQEKIPVHVHVIMGEHFGQALWCVREAAERCRPPGSAAFRCRGWSALEEVDGSVQFSRNASYKGIWQRPT